MDFDFSFFPHCSMKTKLSFIYIQYIYEQCNNSCSGLLMLMCSNVRITEEFSIFDVTFDAAI